MALHLRQNLGVRMEQKLKLTPQMIQSIEILLLPQLALEERIMTEVEANPTLEIVDGPIEGDDAAPAAAPTDRSDRDDQEWLFKRAKSRQDDDAPDKMAALAATPERPPVLAEHLVEQLRFVELAPEVRACAHEIAWQLDRRGYLTVPLSDLFDEDHLEHAEVAYEHIRRCDPAGIGARDLRDCLLLQLAREPGDNSLEIELIHEHLDDLLRNRLPALQAAWAARCPDRPAPSFERLQEALEVLARLDPKPGLPFAASANHIVVPDCVVERDEETGQWKVSVPEGRLPRLEVSGEYQQLVDSPAADAKEKAYLKEKLGAARFIIDAVAQRKRTLLRIVTEIIKHQSAFLEQGQEALRPLLRQDIADRIGMHVATVSRAVKDKYIQTPRGVLPLADFFSNGIASQDGSEAESSKVVWLRIQKMLDEEDRKHPLSDQEIADALAKDGLDIARRTVTKYRIAKGIPSTRQRRVF